MIFADRSDAGRRLAERLIDFAGADVVVLGLPRGGVPVAFEVAEKLPAPLDVIVVRKLGVPFQPELGMGSIGEGDVRIINEDVLRVAGVDPSELAEIENRERAELVRRAHLFRAGRPAVGLSGRIAIVVDDGVATGSTAKAACEVARARGAARVVMATPVASTGAVAALRQEADDVVCLQTPDSFWAVGQWYRDFGQTPDDVVVDLLSRAHASFPPANDRAAGT
jgi:putative phosphoribosyl transferase